VSTDRLGVPAQVDPLVTSVKYWAFISYSHYDKDVVEWLHSALEPYRVPQLDPHVEPRPLAKPVIPGDDMYWCPTYGFRASETAATI
jgi:hypothetical protein